jgi:chromosome segregation ATPase
VADIEQIQAEVNQACSRYKNDKMKMEQLLIDMDNYKSMTESSTARMQSVQSQMSSIEMQISMLQSEISSRSGEEDYDPSYAYNQMNQLYVELQSLQMQYSQEQQTYNKSIASLNRAQAEYSQCEQDLGVVTNFLESVRTEMIKVADYLQDKILVNSNAADIFSIASRMGFGGNEAANQNTNTNIRLNEYQRNLNIAQSVIKQISSTVDDQGSVYTKTLRR